MILNYTKEAQEYLKIYQTELFEKVLPFWVKGNLLDRENGGCITSLDRQGKIYNDDKSVWFQGRCLWTFSALCHRYGLRQEWKEIADSAKVFLEKHCIDFDGRMFFTVTKEGKPLRKRRYMFSESFYVIGMAEYAAAFGDDEALKKAENCFEMMLSIYHDPSSDPFKITPKGYAETRNERAAAVPMVLVSSAQILRRCDKAREEYYSQIVCEITKDILQYHFHPEKQASLETVLQDGSLLDNPAGRTINPGHSCENAWFLMSEAAFTNNHELLKNALNIFDFAFERGWDPDFGGMLYFVDLNNRPCEQLEWDMKLWWVHNETLIASLMAFAMTGEKKYWKRFECVHAYTFSHFPDQEYGEWYGYLHRDGSVSHTQKGSLWKGPFHLPRCLMLCSELLEIIAENGKAKPIL